MKSKINLFTLFSITAMMFLSLLTAQIQAQTPATSFSGDATAVIANANVLGVATVNATIAPTGALPGVGGRLTNGANAGATIDLDGLLAANAALTTGIVTTRTSGGPGGIIDGGGDNTSQSQAVVNNLNLGIGASLLNTGLSVTAATITANTVCTCGPNCTGTSTIENLRVNGSILGSGAGQLPFTVVNGTVTVDANGNVTALPNSQITVTLLNGSTVNLFLNEQTGSGTGSVTVNALRIQANLGLLTNILTTNIIVAQAHSDITCAPVNPNNGSITVDKDVCNSIGQSNTCNGQNNALNGTTISFTVTPVGSGTNGLIPVIIGSNANGTNTVGGFAPSNYLVCEVVPLGFASTPRPNKSGGGTNQQAVGNCILAVIGSGNNVLKFLNGPARATAASVTVTGRVLSPYGRGVSRARVMMTDSTGQLRTAMTNPFGYYSFTDVEAGGTYTFEVRDKRYVFTPKALSLTEDLTNFNFTAQR